MVEVVIDAALEQCGWKDVKSVCEAWKLCLAIKAQFWRKTCGDLGIALMLSQFRKNFGSISLWTFLLRDGIESARQTGGDTVLA